ncbi:MULTISPECIES: LemA family protein [unclassified Granulicatella]|uniref:LemA family protein n=1 Tax=unclassified Granulicatella TaxID=2630493 RepID=UPI001072FBE6|nr:MULTISPECIES: LemA family protein [unclassified Granulicatella]MBF0779616.1 LemA family protein [Granulicatella sp. 19428wC4_WM01]TFU96415.1 LemA family protein [Granulicatella sp. WM01]
MVWFILGLIVVIVLWGIMSYNSLVKLKTWISEAWAQIDVQLQRRNDLIPNLVETVKGYAKYEQETLQKVIEARNRLTNTSVENKQDIMDMSNQLTGALKTVFALAESYPDLKANTNFLQLQEELTNTENKIAYSRQLYNSNVASYNIKVKSIPTNIIANLAHFELEKMLEVAPEVREVPKVSF